MLKFKLMMLFKFISKFFFSNLSSEQLKNYQDKVNQINALENEYESLTDAELRAKTQFFKSKIKDGASLDSLLFDAFAVVREASKRVLKMRHFDVQLIGGMVMHDGKIAEMKTGEGKTLMSTLPAYLNALDEQGVYIVTVNDYLAERDSKWNKQLFEFLDISVGLITSNMSPEERIKAYNADITYGTNNEFGFDYLRDNLAWDPDHLCQRKFNFAIIDEVDSILIDEARTPLIISGPVKDSVDKYKKISKFVKKLKKDQDFTLDEKHKNAVLTESGIDKLEESMKLPNLYSVENMDTAHMAVQCLKAFYLFKKDIDYVVKNKQIAIVDEFTGRILDGRRYSDGLHQAIEAMENVPIQEESQTLASITYQNYFRMFKKLAGMTGTALTEASEFENIYKLPVVPIPTNRPLIRKDESDYIYKSQKGKFAAIVKEVSEINKTGQPILLGTISIETSEYLSNLLTQAGVKHHVLNAKQHKKEAEIIANAGQKGAVTIATNMAGRGTDIVLGKGVKDLGGLMVIGASRHESRRIDNQLRGRSGRQGDPGASRFYVSLDDSLMRLFGSERISKIMHSLGMQEDVPIEHKLISRSIEKAQTKVEKYHFSIRKQILEYDDVMTKQRKSIYDLRKQFLKKENIDTFIKKSIQEVIHNSLQKRDENSTENDLTNQLNQDLDHVFNIKISEPLNQFNSLEIAKEKISELCFTNYQNKKNNPNPEIYEEFVTKRTLLMTLDRKWMDHLHQMDVLREGIGLRAYGQKDPLIEYKKEAYTLFQSLLFDIAYESLTMIFRAVLVDKSETKPTENVIDLDNLIYNQSETKIEQRLQKKEPGRNDKVHLKSPEGEVKEIKWKHANAYLNEGWVKL